MFLIGSAALYLHSPSLNWRYPKDFDYIATELEFKQVCESKGDKFTKIKEKKRGFIAFEGEKPYEFEICGKAESTNLLYEYMRDERMYNATPDVCLMLKMSHRYLKNSPHFLKTMKDIIALKKLGAKLPEFAKEWLPIRERETYDYHHPVLNQSKVDFFKDTFYVYDHDTIHLAVKLGDKPAYESIKKDKAEVNVSKKLFMGAPLETKLATVYEESCVLALERHQIPNDFKPHPGKSFEIALEKVCTSISSGWWREFAYDNYFQVLEMFRELGEHKYVKDFFKAKQNKILKPHIGK